MSEKNHWALLKQLMGTSRDGSCQAVTLSEDDATRTFHVTVGGCPGLGGGRSEWGHTLEEAMDKHAERLGWMGAGPRT